MIYWKSQKVIINYWIIIKKFLFYYKYIIIKIKTIWIMKSNFNFFSIENPLMIVSLNFVISQLKNISIKFYF